MDIKEFLSVTSYTSRIPCAPRKYDVVMVRNRSCPAVSQIYRQAEEDRKKYKQNIRATTRKKQNLQLDPFVIQLNIFDFKVDTDSRYECRREWIVGVSQKQTSLSDTWFEVDEKRLTIKRNHFKLQLALPESPIMRSLIWRSKALSLAAIFNSESSKN